MKNIHEYFNYLYGLERYGMKYSLNNIRILLKSLGNPHKDLRFIHIAGTNGKGATASFAVSILQESGMKTGLFTSPHILEFNERIRINGKKIANSYIKNFLNTNRKLINKVRPSFFEVTTAMAFSYFNEKRVEVVVAEAGLGGRLDSTNIVQPDVSVITPIGMDHMQYLGNTLRKIALEKLGIVKRGTNTVVSDNNPKLDRLFRQKIDSAHLFKTEDRCKVRIRRESSRGIDFELKFDKDPVLKLHTPLLGKYQTINAAAAVLAVRLFNNCGVNSSVVSRGIRNVRTNTGYAGRLQEISCNGRNFIFDISHNPAAIQETLKDPITGKAKTVVFGMMADKDYKPAVKMLMKQFKRVIFTMPSYKRALYPEILAAYAKKNASSKTMEIVCAMNVKDGVEWAKAETKKGDSILIIGSFFLVSDAIKALNLQDKFI